MHEGFNSDLVAREMCSIPPGAGDAADALLTVLFSLSSWQEYYQRNLLGGQRGDVFPHVVPPATVSTLCSIVLVYKFN